MSELWENLSRETAIQLLNRLFGSFDDEIRQLEEKFSKIFEMLEPEKPRLISRLEIGPLAEYFRKSSSQEPCENLPTEVRAIADELIEITMKFLWRELLSSTLDYSEALTSSLS